MKVGVVGTLAAAALLATPALAAAGEGDKATGGGQILVSDRGAGSTVAFTGQEDAGGVKGQVQIVDRAGGTGKNQVKYHGVVDCIEAVGNMARLGGERKSGTGGRFLIVVTDNGEGANSAGDTIFFSRNADVTCDSDEYDDQQTALARGNAQVRDGQTSSSKRSGALALGTNAASTRSLAVMSWRSALKLAGQRNWR